MLNTSFAPWPSFSDAEIAAVGNVLASNKVNYWTGEECRKFEREFAEYTETKHAVALANGTVALDLALHGLGIGAANGGRCTDEVIVTPRTFIASVSCVVNAGAIPVFADVDIDSGNLSAVTIRQAVTQNTRGVIVVHLAGWPADMDPIMALASDRGFKVIEDCAQAHGARYRGRSVGSIGDVGTWSFCQDKIMTTGGEGGMVTTNDRDLWERMWSFKDHGKSWSAVYEREHPPGFRWLHESFGSNWRMLEMQAAIGRMQLRKMAEWTAARRENMARIFAELSQFSGIGGVVRMPLPDCGGCSNASGANCDCVHAGYKCYAYVRPENLVDGWTRDRIVDEFNKRGVPCFQGSCSEVYLERAFDNTDWRPAQSLPNARQLGETSLMWLVHPTLTEEQITLTASVIANIMREASSGT